MIIVTTQWNIQLPKPNMYDKPTIREKVALRFEELQCELRNIKHTTQ
jgi:hypothetical protein